MAISQNFPNISPSLNLNFARSKYLDPRVTFTRTSSATRVNGQGLIEVVSADTPRFDHSYDSSTGTVKSLGLLIEEQRTNLLTYSEQFDNAAWISAFGQDAVVTANNTTAPDGTTTADLITFTPDGTTQSRKEQIIGTQSGTFTASIFVKKGTLDTIYLYVSSATETYPAMYYTFSTDTIGTDNATATRTFYPNGWVRLTATATVPSHTMYSGLISFNTSGTLYAWGAQVEQGAFPTSYIPTTTATVTRTADNASMTGSNFSSWYNSTEGTVLTTTKFNGTPILGIDNRSVYSIIGTGFTWQIWWESTNTGAHINYNGTDFDATIFESDATIFSGDTVKMISALKTNDFAFSQNGGAVQSDTSVLLNSDHNRIDIGSVLETNYLNGTIAQISYYSKRLTNDQLQNLTK